MFGEIMNNKDKITISNITVISAIYFALLQCGYEYYTVGRNKEHINTISSFYIPNSAQEFFNNTKQDTCDVYPYWPRAAMLETASFYINSDISDFYDFEAYKNFIMSATNISDVERNPLFWEWVKAFPIAIKHTIQSNEFKNYIEWENQWIRQQNILLKDELQHLQKIIDFCFFNYKTNLKSFQIVLSPIKCVYSADYHNVNNNFIFSSGEFKLESVIHEILHHIVHPMVQEHKDKIVIYDNHYDGIDSSYYHSDNDSGKMNAFEEFLVRSLTKEFLENTQTTDLKKYICKLLDEDEK